MICKCCKKDKAQEPGINTNICHECYEILVDRGS